MWILAAVVGFALLVALVVYYELYVRETPSSLVRLLSKWTGLQLTAAAEAAAAPAAAVQPQETAQPQERGPDRSALIVQELQDSNRTLQLMTQQLRLAHTDQNALEDLTRAVRAQSEAIRHLMPELQEDDTKKKKLFVKADRPHEVYVSNADYDNATGVLTVPVNLAHCSALELMEVSMPRCMYTVNLHCDSFVVAFVDGSGDVSAEYDVTLAQKDYTYSTLASEVQSKVNTAIVASGRTMAVSVDLNTHKYTFLLNGSQKFFLKFPKPTLGYMLGFGIKNVYPATTTVDDDTPTTYTVVDADAAASTTTYGPEAALTKTTTVLSIDSANVTHSVVTHTGAADSCTSATRADLFGGRYIVVECPELRYSYANNKVISLITRGNEMNYVERSQDPDTMRPFPSPRTLTTLQMNLKIRLPTGEDAQFDSQDLAFVFRFAVKAHYMKYDRSDVIEHHRGFQ